jgi:RNA polymerase-binding transcription factor DksA
MTKKKTSTTKPNAKKASVPAPKAPRAKKTASPVKKTKATKAAPSKTGPPKAPATKAKTPVTKTPRKTKVSKKGKSSASSQRVVAEDGEKKLREIASQTSPAPTEEKLETKGFSMEDVRSILSTRDNEETKADSGEVGPAMSKTGKGKASAAKKGRTSKVKKIQTASIDDILGLAPSTASARPIRDEKKVPKQWLPYYNNLMSLRASLKGALGERSNETLGMSARESSGELSLNSSDAGTETFNRDIALSMVASEQEALVEIEDAIDRIFDGTYGICQETNKPIKKTRLKVVPFTRFSLEGQNLYEQRKRREGDPVTGAFATISDSTMGQED